MVNFSTGDVVVGSTTTGERGTRAGGRGGERGERREEEESIPDLGLLSSSAVKCA